VLYDAGLKLSVEKTVYWEIPLVVCALSEEVVASLGKTAVAVAEVTWTTSLFPCLCLSLDLSRVLGLCLSLLPPGGVC